MGVWAYGSSGPTGYDYVQAGQPSNPEEGETWYDVDADAAFVYDGSTWVEMTVTGHGQLSNVSAGQHRSDSNIRNTVDGQVDAETVDGKHASELGGASVYGETVSAGTADIGNRSPSSSEEFVVTYLRFGTEDLGSGSFTVDFDDGSSVSRSSSQGDGGPTYTFHDLHRYASSSTTTATNISWNLDEGDTTYDAYFQAQWLVLNS